jgi:hypothetical protein
MRPRRYRLRFTVACIRALLWVLSAIDDAHFRWHHSTTDKYYRRIAQ